MNIYRSEHPCPQFERDDWICLNGEWDFEIDNGLTGIERDFVKATSFSKKINVPFCPESRLSGLEFKDFMNGVWYTRSFSIPENWEKNLTFLHIGACDYETLVYINGSEVGFHKGGYISFKFDITPFVKKGENRVTIFAKDNTRSANIPSGKQSAQYNSFGCYYTRTTGIWQTVWLESIPKSHIESVKMTPFVSDNGILIEYRTENSIGKTLHTEISYKGNPIIVKENTVSSQNGRVFITLPELHLWSPETPELYDVMFTLGEDTVHSYFGMREFILKDGKTYLNGKPLFQRLILDQGFYPDSIYTAPSDEALINDIKISLNMGFNGARLHEKIFEPRFLYHADRLGYLVWGEYPNWGLDVSSPEAYKNMLPEWLEELERDYNHPSIIGWCPLNETQHDIDPEFAKLLYRITKGYDPYRLFIDNSGWHHIDGAYDMLDVHDYLDNPTEFRKKYSPLENGEPVEYMDDNDSGFYLKKSSEKINFVSEFGGIGWYVNANGEHWGYGNQVANEEEFIARYSGLVDALLDNPKICAFCYTQLTDVEQECNGLYTYDRKAKFNSEKLYEINSRRAASEKS